MLNSRRTALMIGMAAAALLTAGAMIMSTSYVQPSSTHSETRSLTSALNPLVVGSLPKN